MKSDVCYLYKGKGQESVLKEIEKTAVYCELEHKESLQLRLLAEELTGMMTGIVGDYKARFWIEAENGKFNLHLLVEILLRREDREKLKEISKGTAQAKGVMGKIRTFFETCSDNYSELGVYCAQNGQLMTNMESMYEASNVNAGLMTWSLKRYEEKVSKEKRSEEWDELEKSIVANLADDISVKIQGHQTEIVVKKQFEDA